MGATDADYLRTIVPLMRELGVQAFGDVVLGPATAPAPPREENQDERMKLAQKQAAEREERMRYGASGGPRPRGPFER